MLFYSNMFNYEVIYMIASASSFFTNRFCVTLQLWIAVSIGIGSSLFALSLALAENNPNSEQQPSQEQIDSTPDSDYWKQFHEHYDKLSKEGRNKAEQAIEWMREDISNIGRWEYRIERIESSDDSFIEQKLNALGLERWQCYQVLEDKTGALRVFLKRPKQSVVRAFPFKDTLNLLNQEK